MAAQHGPSRLVALPLLVVLAVLVAAATLWVGASRPTAGPVTVSGTLEVDEVTLSAETAGRLADLAVGEGSRVVEGQVVGHLTDPLLTVQSKQAVADPAQQQLTQAQLSRLELAAPLTGVVQKQIAHRGEFVTPGAPILTLADPTNLKLTLFVREADLARVNVGQTVSVRADGFADRVFLGQITTIGSRAEFTPKNVQTAKDRQNLVFAVTVRVPNADGALKSGVPVDATLEP